MDVGIEPGALREAGKKALLARLARIEGQVRGVRRMIEADEGCEGVAQPTREKACQILA